jgi:hypothetical protein
MAIQFNKLSGEAKSSDVTYMKLVNGINVFRILPDSILPSYTYWIKGAEGRELPFECLQFVRDREKFDNSLPDPVKDLGIKNDKGEDVRCQWAYKALVINKATGAVEVLQLKKGILNDIISVAKQTGMDPTDLDTGCWIHVERKKTGPLPYNVEYAVQQLKCISSPLEPEYRELAQNARNIEEMFPRETYEEQMERLKRHLEGKKEQPSMSPRPDIDNEAVSELG